MLFSAALTLCCLLNLVSGASIKVLPPRGSVHLSGQSSKPIDNNRDDLAMPATPSASGGTISESSAGTDSEGSGCKAGGAVARLSEQGDVIDIIYDSFVASIAPDDKHTDRRKFCTTTFDLDVPAGYTFGIENLEWHGYVNIEPGVLADFNTKFGIGDEKLETKMRRTVKGAFTADYVYGTDDNKRPIKFKECSTGGKTTLTIGTAITVRYDRPITVQRGKGIIGVDSADGKLKQSLSLNWKPCTAK